MNEILLGWTEGYDNVQQHEASSSKVIDDTAQLSAEIWIKSVFWLIALKKFSVMLSQLSAFNSYHAMARVEGDGKERMEVNIANTHLGLNREVGSSLRAFFYLFVLVQNGGKAVAPVAAPSTNMSCRTWILILKRPSGWIWGWKWLTREDQSAVVTVFQLCMDNAFFQEHEFPQCCVV